MDESHPVKYNIYLTVIIFFLHFVLAGYCACKGQNLIPNPSFEDTLQCPTSLSNLDNYCSNWESFRGSPDYFNDCSNTLGSNNPRGFQQAHSGNAYAGFAGFHLIETTNQEQLGVKLLSPLEVECTYHLQFYISISYRFYAWNIICDNIGILLTTNAYHDPTLVFPVSNFCTYRFDSLISDTSTWIEVNYSFTTDSAYEYLIIGAFFNNQSVDTFSIYPFDSQTPMRGSFIYIDDVTLIKDKNCNKNEFMLTMPNVFTPNGDWINDVFRPKATIYESNCKLQIFNRWGQEVYITNDVNKGWDGGNAPEGTYYWIIFFNNNNIINYKSGFITILRN